MINRSLLHSESTLTSRYQTTIPEPIRKALHLNKNDKIGYDILDNGQVVLSRTISEGEDPVLSGFLGFLEQDMINNPETIQAVPQKLINKADKLIEGMDIDLNGELSPEDD